jgi:hypothetical protein
MNSHGIRATKVGFQVVVWVRPCSLVTFQTSEATKLIKLDGLMSFIALFRVCQTWDLVISSARFCCGDSCIILNKKKVATLIDLEQRPSNWVARLT